MMGVLSRVQDRAISRLLYRRLTTVLRDLEAMFSEVEEGPPSRANSYSEVERCTFRLQDCHGRPGSAVVAARGI